MSTKSERKRRATKHVRPHGDDFKARVKDFQRLVAQGVDESSPEFARAQRRITIAQCGNLREFATLSPNQWLMSMQFCTAAPVSGKLGVVNGPFQWVENSDDFEFVGTQFFRFLNDRQSDAVVIKIEDGYRSCSWCSENQPTACKPVPDGISAWLIETYEHMKEEFAGEHFYPTVAYVRCTKVSVLRAAEMTN